MDDMPGLAPHEFFGLHEILAAEVTAARKMQANMAVVQDRDLKAFMQDAIAARQRRTNRIQQLMNGVRTMR